jgi:hypothetical protein
MSDKTEKRNHHEPAFLFGEGNSELTFRRRHCLPKRQGGVLPDQLASERQHARAENDPFERCHCSKVPPNFDRY